MIGNVSNGFIQNPGGAPPYEPENNPREIAQGAIKVFRQIREFAEETIRLRAPCSEPNALHLNWQGKYWLTDQEARLLLAQSKVPIRSLRIRGCTGLSDGFLQQLAFRSQGLKSFDLAGTNVSVFTVRLFIALNLQTLESLALSEEAFPANFVPDLMKSFPHIRFFQFVPLAQDCWEQLVGPEDDDPDPPWPPSASAHSVKPTASTLSLPLVIDWTDQPSISDEEALERLADNPGPIRCVRLNGCTRLTDLTFKEIARRYQVASSIPISAFARCNKELFLAETKISNEVLKMFAEKSEEMTHIDLSHTKVDDETLRIFGERCHRLRLIKLVRTDISPDTVRFLKNSERHDGLLNYIYVAEGQFPQSFVDELEEQDVWVQYG